MFQNLLKLLVPLSKYNILKIKVIFWYFKRKYVLTEFIEYFKSRAASVYVAFLDASKAFDKISHWTLFIKLIDKA